MIENLNQNRIVVEVTDLASSNKKNVFRVLHVDDDFSLLEVSKQILMDMGNFDIDTACCVDEAFRKLGATHYDAVISDYELPLKNGLQFLRELREQKNDIPFVLFTGKGREDVAIKALNLGADRYVNKQGNPETVYGELSDALIKTIEHKQSKRLHAESESKYRTLVENSLQGIAIIQGPPPKFVFVNSAMGELFGYSPEEMIALTPEQIKKNVHTDDRETFFNRFRNRIEGKERESTYEFRGFRKDGTIRWMEVCANLIEFNGRPAVQGVFLDITKSKKAAEILSESEQKYRELANCLPDIVFETDLNGKVEFVNERAAEISGYSLSEIEKGLNILQFIVPEDKEKAMKSIQRLLSGGKYVPTEYTFTRKDGKTFPALIAATPRICKNKVTGLRGLVLDISERKKSEEAVKKSEVRYRELANFLPEIVFEADLSGKITFFNQRAFEITGFTPEELEKGMNMLQFVVSQEREKAKANIKKALSEKGRESHEYTLYKKDGFNYPAIVKTAPIISENKVTGLRGLIIDITERKKLELELKQKYTVLERVGGKHWCRSGDYRKGLQHLLG